MVSYVMALSMISCSVGVLILVVVEDGLVRNCCIGRPVQIIVLILVVVEDGLVRPDKYGMFRTSNVLILVVVEDGLVLNDKEPALRALKTVLILGVVEDGLVQRICSMLSAALMRLNTCCSGRWSSTMQWSNNQRSTIK